MSTADIPDSFPAVAGDLSTLSLSPLFELVLGCRLTFSERLDERVLARAVRVALDAEPVLGSWLDEGLSSGTWRRCTDLSGSFDLMPTTDADTDSAAFHAERFDPRGPRLAVRLLRSEAADDLCLRLDHGAGDGWSAKHVAYMLADAYSALLDDEGWDAQPDNSPRPSYSEVWDALTDDQKAAAETRPRIATPRWRMRIVRGNGNDLGARRLALGPDRLSRVKAYAAERGATVNDAIVAALLRSLARAYPPPANTPLGVSISADLRRVVGEQPPFDRVCVLASPQTVGVRYDAADGFDRTLENVADAIAPWKRCSWGIGAMHGRTVPHRLMRGVWRTFKAVAGSSGTLPPVVMNIGVLEQSRLQFGRALPDRAYILGSFGKAPAFGATISTYGGELTVWMGAWERDVDPEELERVLGGIDEELRVAGASAPAEEVSA